MVGSEIAGLALVESSLCGSPAPPGTQEQQPVCLPTAGNPGRKSRRGVGPQAAASAVGMLFSQRPRGGARPPTPLQDGVLSQWGRLRCGPVRRALLTATAFFRNHCPCRQPCLLPWDTSWEGWAWDAQAHRGGTFLALALCVLPAAHTSFPWAGEGSPITLRLSHSLSLKWSLSSVPLAAPSTPSLLSFPVSSLQTV